MNKFIKISIITFSLLGSLSILPSIVLTKISKEIGAKNEIDKKYLKEKFNYKKLEDILYPESSETKKDFILYFGTYWCPSCKNFEKILDEEKKEWHKNIKDIYFWTEKDTKKIKKEEFRTLKEFKKIFNDINDEPKILKEEKLEDDIYIPYFIIFKWKETEGKWIIKKKQNMTYEYLKSIIEYDIFELNL